MRIALLVAVLLAVVVTPAQAGTLVAYDRVGGIAGEETRVTVSAKGRVVMTSTLYGDRTTKLSAERLERLESVLRKARFATLRDEYLPEGVVSDGQSETVTYAGRSVRTSTGAEHPRRFERVLRKLRGISQ